MLAMKCVITRIYNWNTAIASRELSNISGRNAISVMAMITLLFNWADIFDFTKLKSYMGI